MSELPPSWAHPTIGLLCDLVNGRAFKPSDWTEIGLPIVRIQNLNKPEAPFNRFNGDVKDKFLIDSGQLLFAWSGTPGTSFGAHIWNGGPAVLNQHIFKVEFDEQCIDKKYLQYAINQKLQELINKAHGGVGLRHVTKGKFEETEIELPPTREQKRIVTKLDSLFERTRRAHEELSHIPLLIDHYKQAILSAAFSGTSDARSGGTPVKFDNIPLSEIIYDGPTNGWSPKSAPEAGGALTLKLTATTSGKLRLDEKSVKRIFETPEPTSKYWLKPGDILVQRANTIEYLGATAIFDGPERTFIYPDLMMRIRIRDENLRWYVWRYLNSSNARQYIRDRATGTAGNMPKISGKILKSLPVPLPENKDVANIVEFIDNAFSWIDSLVHEVTSATELIDHLDQANLAKAFRGELVPQTPDDEPASVLLDRIRAERAAQPKTKRNRRKKGAVA